MKKLLAAAIAAMLLCGCADGAGPASRPVNETHERFILGVDTSCVPALEAGGVKYSNAAGEEKDVFRILSESGVNCIRVRIWNDPFDAEGRGYGGGNCDMENALEIARRAADYGMALIPDFHYSDFWADPGKQKAPKAWESMNVDEKSEALYLFTRDSLQRLADTGVEIAIVQLGNETNSALCSETEWANIAWLMNAGARAVREVCPEALTAVHFTNPEKGSYGYYGEMLDTYGVDYDVFASSWYPYWHGSLENLSSELNRIADTYGKKVMVAETSYACTSRDTDFHGNTVGEGMECSWPFSPEGQAEMLRDLYAVLTNDTKNCIGLCYWEGTWIAAGGSSLEENKTLWETCGSGWASSWATEYDPEDAGEWYGGCAVENQALFDENGRATKALEAFGLLSAGGEDQ